MELVIKGLGTNRWVVPFEKFPGFRVEMRELGRDEIRRVAKKYNLSTSHTVPEDVGRALDYVDELNRLQIISIEGEEEVFGCKVSLENLDPFLQSDVRDVVVPDGNGGTTKITERVSMYLQRKYAEQETVDLGN